MIPLYVEESFTELVFSIGGEANLHARHTLLWKKYINGFDSFLREI